MKPKQQPTNTWLINSLSNLLGNWQKNYLKHKLKQLPKQQPQSSLCTYIAFFSLIKVEMVDNDNNNKTRQHLLPLETTCQ